MILLAACTTPGSQVVQRPGLPGVYVVNGFDPVGNEYSGTVSIEETGAGSVRMEWVITGAILQGDGVVDGDTLDVTWESVQTPRGSSSGTARYTIEPDGTLHGVRTIDGVSGEGTEEIFPSG
jgi:hypothetical protein